MTFEVFPCAPAQALSTLSHALGRAKGSDPLAAVTVVVPTNVAGVMARRALGAESGILGVDMVTVNRLAELLAGPALAHQKRQPVSTPLLELTVRQVLDEAPGSYAAVAHHPATVVALRELHQELRLAGDPAAVRLAQSARGREAVRVSRAVTRILQRRWYDEADLLVGATERLRTEQVPDLDRVVLHLPAPFDALSAELVRELSSDRVVHVVSAFTGDAAADHEQHRLLDQLGVSLPADSDSDSDPAQSSRPARVVSTTDADDEVRVAVRTIIDAARGELTGTPVPFERIAVLWPNQQPYARLVEHHLNADDIPWNGRGGTELTERIAPRLLLDLLDVDRRGLQRRPLFELLADVPAAGADGRTLPTAEWERVSRRAGVSRDEDWLPRLGALREHERWGAAATSLREFVVELRQTLGPRHAKQTWAEWVDWCDAQLGRWLGPGAIARLSDSEYRGWEALMSALERLKSLDSVAEPVTRAQFRTVLENELADAAVREGRIGTGVTIGSLASASGLVIDVAIVLGAAEGQLPPTPRADPLLSTADRERADLAAPDERARRLHHAFAATISSAHTVVTMPRGDLRATTTNHITRWLEADGHDEIAQIDSSTIGLEQLTFAPCERERRLRDRLRHVAATGPLKSIDSLLHDDAVSQRGLALADARRQNALSEFDGDLTAVGVPHVAIPMGGSHDGRRPVSPTQIERWVSCPHAYFVRHVLGVLPIDEPDSQLSINPLDRGLIQHDVVDALHRDVLAGALPQPTDTGWTDEHRRALSGHFDAACADAERMGRTGRPAAWASDRERMRHDLFGWFDADSEVNRSRGVTILASELRFPDQSDQAASAVVLELPDGRRLPVHGSLDRLDRGRNGELVVTDHKTGKPGSYRKLSEADPTLDGTVFQLPTYAAAALALAPDTDGNPPSRVRAEYSMFALGKYQRHGIEFDDDVWRIVSDHIGEVVDGIEAGWFPQVPQAPGFRMFADCPYCEPDELGTTDAFARWSAKRSDPRVARWFGAPTDEGDTTDA